ncbi:hypothetical protein D910_00584 [Dendroctonus ponderosae]|uniref:Uncharacterized protein n=1 Tax=Dendroctonus ponderosae TaxID=77166 RepID=U4TUC4_DENPD|nr:hypothetical protein D910_00584 [Dendroctonus ponderosae]
MSRIKKIHISNRHLWRLVKKNVEAVENDE